MRAGVLEQHVVDTMIATGVGDRLRREGLRHGGVWLAFHGERRRIDFEELTGKAITVYGQNEVVKDLIAARKASGRPIEFEVADVSVHDFETDSPRVRYRSNGQTRELGCRFIAGCDGFHGICRSQFPAGALTTYERAYSLRMAGHPGPCGAIIRRAGLFASRTGLCAVQHAILGRDPALSAVLAQ